MAKSETELQKMAFNVMIQHSMVGSVVLDSFPFITDGTSWVGNPFSVMKIFDNMSARLRGFHRHYLSVHTITKIQ
jgi:hypothetical protein